MSCESCSFDMSSGHYLPWETLAVLLILLHFCLGIVGFSIIASCQRCFAAAVICAGSISVAWETAGRVVSVVTLLFLSATRDRGLSWTVHMRVSVSAFT